jgi:hypothetical protein
MLRFLVDQHGSDDDTRIIEEMGIWAGSVRVDIAVINGEIQGFELKSARDTLERLDGQAALYSEVFDRMTLVVAERHLEKARTRVPEWWGLSQALEDAERRVLVDILRKAKPNPHPNPFQIARLLWRGEALSVLERHGLARGFRSKAVDALAHRLGDELPLDLLRFEVRALLKARPRAIGSMPLIYGGL